MQEVTPTVPRANPDSSIVAAGSLPNNINIHALLEHRRGQVRRREFTPVGALEKVFFDPVGIANADARTNLLVANRETAVIEWRGTGPLIGMTKDTRNMFLDVLVCSPMFHPPALPPPDWKARPAQTAVFRDGIPVPPDVPMIPQRFRDRAASILPAAAPSKWQRWFGRNDSEEDFYFVVAPLTQLVILLPDNSGIVDLVCKADEHGRHTTLLYNPHRLEGHIVFGGLELQNYPLWPEKGMGAPWETMTAGGQLWKF